MAADGKLEPGKLWKQASIIGSQFIASYEQAGEYVIPTIRGETYMSAEATLFMDENDPFAWGIQALPGQSTKFLLSASASLANNSIWSISCPSLPVIPCAVSACLTVHAYSVS